MAYLSPIPRRRDRKGAGTARILALLGRAGLAEMQRRKSVREAAQKAAQEAEKTAYERAKDARAEGRAEEGLHLRRDEAARSAENYEYDKSRRPIEESKAEADRLWDAIRRAHEQGDWKTEAEAKRQLAELRSLDIEKARAEKARGYTTPDRGDGPTEELRKEWIDHFNSNYGMLPAGLDGRIKQLTEGRTVEEASEAMARAFFGGEADGEGSKFYQPIPNNVLASPEVLEAMWNRMVRLKSEYGIIGDTEGQRSAFMEAVKKMFVWGYGSRGESEDDLDAEIYGEGNE